MAVRLAVHWAKVNVTDFVLIIVVRIVKLCVRRWLVWRIHDDMVSLYQLAILNKPLAPILILEMFDQEISVFLHEARVRGGDVIVLIRIIVQVEEPFGAVECVVRVLVAPISDTIIAPRHILPVIVDVHSKVEPLPGLRRGVLQQLDQRGAIELVLGIREVATACVVEGWEDVTELGELGGLGALLHFDVELRFEGFWPG